jgi:hypothetical protein
MVRRYKTVTAAGTVSLALRACLLSIPACGMLALYLQYVGTLFSNK